MGRVKLMLLIFDVPSRSLTLGWSKLSQPLLQMRHGLVVDISALWIMSVFLISDM